MPCDVIKLDNLEISLSIYLYSIIHNDPQAVWRKKNVGVMDVRSVMTTFMTGGRISWSLPNYVCQESATLYQIRLPEL